MQGKRNPLLKDGEIEKQAAPGKGSSPVSEKPKTSFLAGCLGCFGLLGAVAFIAVVVVEIVGNETEEHDQKRVIPAAVHSPTAGIETQVRQYIVEAVGETTNLDVARIVKLEVNDHAGTPQEGDKIVVATLCGNDNLTTRMIKGSMQLDAIRVFEALFKLPEIEEVVLLWRSPSKADTESPITVLKLSVTREATDRIDWSSIDKDDLETAASSYWEAPAWRE